MGGSLFSGQLGSAFGSAPLSVEAMGCYAVGFDLDGKSGGLPDSVEVCDKEKKVVVLYANKITMERPWYCKIVLLNPKGRLSRRRC
jgi:hypothetical protein